jgi:hypothetical protein
MVKFSQLSEHFFEMAKHFFNSVPTIVVQIISFPQRGNLHG